MYLVPKLLVIDEMGYLPLDGSKRLTTLSITHILGAQPISDGDIRKPRQTTPYDSVGRRRVVRSDHMTSESRQLRQ